MQKKNLALAVALAALTFLLLLVGSRFYEVYALQKPLLHELSKYNISKIDFNQQERNVTLYPQKNSDLQAAVKEIVEKFGNVKLNIVNNSSEKINSFYNKEALYILQFIELKQYGILQEYLERQGAEIGLNTEIKIDERYVYIKITDNNSAYFAIFERQPERGVS